MARMALDIPEDLNKRFRQRIIEKYGSKKGALTIAICEAIELWLKEKK